ncbi:DUF763 domain-containing protein [candidate division WOR-3 bacterium]|uniref:DUF763 domain-containing protein n=1 Tax=candidate division WOR-3 bacterium TaxID=2052148 RepID=A0A660SPD1_UNCW3|nr:MAG: DUF763 domain-containing protein [candidate division WOR-3 bacterium]
MRTGICDLPLHSGRAPRWLFERMAKLSREIFASVVEFYGPEEFLDRLADPIWFQALGCVLGFDWHSSGLTTTTGGALKLAINPIGHHYGIWVCGGKGATSRKTPEEIGNFAERIGITPEPLIRASRLSAKVDNTALQDGYQLYHHIFIFSKDGNWAVIQQGMNPYDHYARRYHWRSRIKSFTSDPHQGIVGRKESGVLNLVDGRIEGTRRDIVTITRERPERLLKEIRHLRFPSHHPVGNFAINRRYLRKVIIRIREHNPADFETLLLTRGLGPKSLRAFALLANLICGSRLSYTDPVTFSFAHGGKDGHPFPVERGIYDQSIRFLAEIIHKARINSNEKDRLYQVLQRLSS